MVSEKKVQKILRMHFDDFIGWCPDYWKALKNPEIRKAIEEAEKWLR